MEIPIVLPELGIGEEAARVSGWLVDEGDMIETGDRIVEVLVRGISFDVSATSAGRLGRIEKPLNSTVVAGDTLGWIDTEPGERPV